METTQSSQCLQKSKRARKNQVYFKILKLKINNIFNRQS